MIIILNTTSDEGDGMEFLASIFVPIWTALYEFVQQAPSNPLFVLMSFTVTVVIVFISWKIHRND